MGRVVELKVVFNETEDPDIVAYFESLPKGRERGRTVRHLLRTALRGQGASTVPPATGGAEPLGRLPGFIDREGLAGFSMGGTDA